MVGQHIRAQKGGRWVHAIDCGDETVLHLAEQSAAARVRRAYKPEFVAGSTSVEIVTHRERTFPAKEIVRRAYSRASDPALAAMFRDSEAFAAWCATGREPSGRNAAVEVPAPAIARPAAPVRKAAPRKPGKARAARKPAPIRKAKRAAKGKPKTARPRGAKAAKAGRKGAARKATAKRKSRR